MRDSTIQRTVDNSIKTTNSCSFDPFKSCRSLIMVCVIIEIRVRPRVNFCCFSNSQMIVDCIPVAGWLSHPDKSRPVRGCATALFHAQRFQGCAICRLGYLCIHVYQLLYLCLLVAETLLLRKKSRFILRSSSSLSFCSCFDMWWLVPPIIIIQAYQLQFVLMCDFANCWIIYPFVSLLAPIWRLQRHIDCRCCISRIICSKHTPP